MFLSVRNFRPRERPGRVSASTQAFLDGREPAEYREVGRVLPLAPGEGVEAVKDPAGRAIKRKA